MLQNKNANVPRLYNEYIVYDTVQSNSLVAISNTGSYNSIIFEKGILVNTADNSIPSFQSYNGILYYSNDGDLLSTQLTANNMLYVNSQSEIEQITTDVINNGINGGVLTTYSFDNKSLTDNTKPKFSSQFILNNAEVVDNNQRIDQPYLIYGKGYKTNDTGGGISYATTIFTEQNTTYNLLSVNNSNNTIELSNIHNVVQQLQSINENTSFQLVGFDNNNNRVSLINSTSVNVKNNENYVLKITENDISLNTLDNAFGQVTPDKLDTDTTNNFDYTKHKILSVNDDNNNKFIEIPNYNGKNELKYPYFTGTQNVDGNYWQDLSTQPFLTVSNTTSINNINSFKPVVVNTTNNNICTLNNIGTGNYIISSVNGVCQYKQIGDITDVYVSGQNLDVTKINNRQDLETNTLLNLSTILCMSNTNSTLFQNIGNVNTSGVLQIGTDENIKVNNTIIPNITDLTTTSSIHTAQISQLSTASSIFAIQISNLQSTSNTHTTQIKDLTITSNTHTAQITNLSNAKCVINQNRTSAINIQNILTNSTSDPTDIIRGHITYTSGVMYLDNSKNIQTTPPSTTDQTLISTSNGYS